MKDLSVALLVSVHLWGSRFEIARLSGAGLSGPSADYLPSISMLLVEIKDELFEILSPLSLNFLRILLLCLLLRILRCTCALCCFDPRTWLPLLALKEFAFLFTSSVFLSASTVVPRD